MIDSESHTPSASGTPALEPDPVRDAHAQAFKEAWKQLGALAADTIAPEATYQAWLAHLVIQRLGMLHVVREVDFGVRHMGEAAAARFGGSNLMVDSLILREPVVTLPRRAALAVRELPDGQPNPKSGLARLRDFTVITELKVSATQSEGLDYGEVVRDFEKLSAILDAAAGDHSLLAGSNPSLEPMHCAQIRHEILVAELHPGQAQVHFQVHRLEVVVD